MNNWCCGEGARVALVRRAVGSFCNAVSKQTEEVFVTKSMHERCDWEGVKAASWLSSVSRRESAL